MSNPSHSSLSTVDVDHLNRCLELAQQGLGRVHPNPMVGAVVVNAAGEVVGEGYHAAYGQDHAEVMAIRQAGEQARGSTLYVSLEPCNHHGQTPPCTQAILEAGITKVVYAMDDPNPNVAGGGGETLRLAGITTVSNAAPEAASSLNKPFLHRIRCQKPFTILKLAMSLDGRIATRQGHSQWISSAGARQWVHQWRSISDGILTTAQTVLADNAAMTVREVPIKRIAPRRIVLDRQGKLLKKAMHEPIAMFEPIEYGGPVTLMVSPSLDVSQYQGWCNDHHVQVIPIQETGTGLDLHAVMNHLGHEQLTQCWVEAGGRLAGQLLQQSLVQTVFCVVGPIIMGDPAARPAFVMDPIAKLDEAVQLTLVDTQTIDGCLVAQYELPE